MQYWIDGYNLLFKMPNLQGPLEEKRRQLILDLNAYSKKLHLSFVLVFDAKTKDAPLALRSHYDSLEILYATGNKTADEAILEEIELLGISAQACVVTSDRGLSHQARMLGTSTMSLSEFVQFLTKKQKKRSFPLVESKDSPKEIERLCKIFEERLRLKE